MPDQRLPEAMPSDPAVRHRLDTLASGVVPAASPERARRRGARRRARRRAATALAALAAVAVVAVPLARSQHDRTGTVRTVVSGPDDETATRQAIERAVRAGILGQGTDDPDAFIDDPHGLADARAQLRAAYPEQADARLVMRSITITSSTTAVFVYDVELVPPLAPQSLRDMAGAAVVVDGTWKVTRASACRVWSFGNGVCPGDTAPPGKGTVAPTTTRPVGPAYRPDPPTGIDHGRQPTTTLTDGRHVVDNLSLDLAARTVTFDRALWFTPSEYASGVAAGWIEPGNDCLELDYCVVQEYGPRRTLPVAPGARISVVDWDRCCGSVRTDSFDSLRQRSSPDLLFVVTVANGVITALDELYHP